LRRSIPRRNASSTTPAARSARIPNPALFACHRAAAAQRSATTQSVVAINPTSTLDVSLMIA
jgi:hypothetical protein